MQSSVQLPPHFIFIFAHTMRLPFRGSEMRVTSTHNRQVTGSIPVRSVFNGAIAQR